MANYLVGFSVNVADVTKFGQILDQTIAQFRPIDGIIVSDNLIAWHRNLSFLDDGKLMELMALHATGADEKGIIWRTYIYIWCMEQALRLDGDLLECACYKGTTVRIACDYLDFKSYAKQFLLFDLFDPVAYGLVPTKPELGLGLYEKVVDRFADLANVSVIKGRVPEILVEHCPAKIAFLHLDMNNAEAEIAALDILFDRIVPGGWILLDDYGWLQFREQKIAEDAFFQARGLRPMELPTGQAIVIKPLADSSKKRVVARRTPKRKQKL